MSFTENIILDFFLNVSLILLYKLNHNFISSSKCEPPLHFLHASAPIFIPQSSISNVKTKEEETYIDTCIWRKMAPKIPFYKFRW